MKKNILLLFASILLVSCHDDDPYRHTNDPKGSKYWFSEYFIPNQISGGRDGFKTILVDGKEKRVEDSTIFYVDFESNSATTVYTEDYNKNKFFEYTQAYHEKGDTLFFKGGYSKPVGIKSFKMYVVRNKEYIDVSDNILVKYENDSLIIANHYSKQSKRDSARIVTKKLSELTEYDYKWFPTRVHFEVINKTIDSYWLHVEFDNVQVWFPFNSYLKEEHKKH